MSNELSPRNAAVLANLAYTAYRSDDVADFAKNAAATKPGEFTAIGDLIKGRTGFSKIANSAVVFNHEAKGAAEKVISIRGTQGGLLSQDWLTNANVGLVPGPNGTPCHAGFYLAYRSLRDEIIKTIGTAHQTVHVVGHSLGGAQATLMALDLSSRGHDTYLYTFGAPRVGPLAFTYSLDSAFKSKLYRVYDPGDPVPMLPLFPFLHPPLRGQAYKSGENRHSISGDFHSMDDWYVPSAEAVGGWSGMRERFAGNELIFGPAAWLKQAGQATRIPGAGMGLFALGKAFEAILKSIGSVIQTGISAALTAPDMLAWALHYAIDIGGQTKDWALEWISCAMRWLGREVIRPAGDITRTFLQYLFQLLFRALTVLVHRALERV